MKLFFRRNFSLASITALSLALAIGGLTAHAQSFGLSDVRLDYNSGSGNVGVADLNGDGWVDLVIPIPHQNALAVRLGDGQGHFNEHALVPVGSGPEFVVVADLDGNGTLDLISANVNGGSVSVCLATSHGAFRPSVSYNTGGTSSREVVLGDFNGDSITDLAASTHEGGFAGRGTGNLVVLLGNGSGAFSRQEPVNVGLRISQLRAADLNGDSATDLVALRDEDSTGGTIKVLLADGKGSFKPPTEVPSQSSAASTLCVADLNADGKLDLAMRTSDTIPQIAIFSGDGAGNFAQAAAFAEPAWPVSSILAGDFNHDGRVDLALAAQNALHFLLGDEGGQFSHSGAVAPGLYASAAADLNGDGAADLVGWRDGAVQFLLDLSKPRAFRAEGIKVQENQQSATVILTRATAISDFMSVDVSTRDDTALQAIDYTAVSTRVTFAPGETRKEVSVPVLDNDYGRPTRSFYLDFSNGTSPFPQPWPARVDITDDDEPIVFAPTAPAYTVKETAGAAIVQLIRSGSTNSTHVVRVRYTAKADPNQSSIPDVDFTPVTGVLEFGPGVLSKDVSIPIVNNGKVQTFYRPFVVEFEPVDESYAGLPNSIHIGIADDERPSVGTRLDTELTLMRPYLVPLEVGYMLWSLIGQGTNGPGAPPFAVVLARLTPDGFPDYSWNANGKLRLPPSTASDISEGFSEMGVQVREHSIWVFQTIAAGILEVRRFDHSGALLNTFRIPEIGPSWVQVLSNEQLLAVNLAGELHRYNPDGRIDADFNPAVLAMSYRVLADELRTLVISSNGLQRLLPNGAMDTSFKPPEGVDVSYLYSISDWGAAMVLMKDGSIGRFASNGDFKPIIGPPTRFEYNGNAMETSDGRSVVARYSGWGRMTSVHYSLVQPDGSTTSLYDNYEIDGKMARDAIWVYRYSEDGRYGILRISLPAAQTQLGFASTVEILTNRSSGIRLIRNGETTSRMSAAVQVIPVGPSGPQNAYARNVHVTFLENHGETRFSIPADLIHGGSAVNEFRVNILLSGMPDAPEVAIPSSRVLIVPVDPNAIPGKLQINAYPSSARDGVALLTFYGKPQVSYTGRISSDLKDWGDWWEGDHYFNAGQHLHVEPIFTQNKAAQFYRIYPDAGGSGAGAATYELQNGRPTLILE